MIVLGSDHAGYSLKRKVIEYLEERGIEYTDVGADECERAEYPVFALKAARLVTDGLADRGLLFCGTGMGMSIAANKVKGIRCVVGSEPYSAAMSRKHNDCNMLALGVRVIGEKMALAIVDTWLNTDFEGERHQKRVDMIMEIQDTGGLEL